MSYPFTVSEFRERLMAAGPFGPTPRFAVAVSGGADSMALLLLAKDWAPGVRVAALTVDHGLRAGSDAEAAQVAAWCASRRIPHSVLAWTGGKPSSGIQEAARIARYGLLTQWCRDRGYPHLLVGHHLEDQAETFLIRMQRGSGIDGLAAMPSTTSRDGVRLVRPLLGVPRSRLTACLRAAGQPWIEDPSNDDPRFARVAIRARMAELHAAGIPAEAVGRAAAALAGQRATKDRAVSGLAARSVAFFPEGYAEVDGETFRAAGAETSRSLLSGLLRVVGGARHPVRRQRIERLLAFLRGGGTGRTLGNCLVVPIPGGFRVCREPRTVREVRRINGEGRMRWDRRFDIEAGPAAWSRPAEIRALGEAGWRAAMPAADSGAARRLPGPVRFALPALWVDGEVIEAPHIGYTPPGGSLLREARFRPDAPLCGPPFSVAKPVPRII